MPLHSQEEIQEFHKFLLHQPCSHRPLAMLGKHGDANSPAYTVKATNHFQIRSVLS